MSCYLKALRRPASLDLWHSVVVSCGQMPMTSSSYWPSGSTAGLEVAPHSCSPHPVTVQEITVLVRLSLSKSGQIIWVSLITTVANHLIDFIVQKLQKKWQTVCTTVKLRTRLHIVWQKQTMCMGLTLGCSSFMYDYEQVVHTHTHVPVTKQYNLVPTQGSDASVCEGNCRPCLLYTLTLPTKRIV